MTTFRDLDAKLGLVPAAIVTQLARIDLGRGREALYQGRRAGILDRLVEVARVQSAESSSAIEGVTAPPARIRALMDETTQPRNRSEAEIAGYRAALDLIHQNAGFMPLTSNVVRQLHRDLYRFSGVPGGSWKTADNHIEEVGPDGTRNVVFQTVPMGDVPAAMDDLNAAMARASDSGHHHRALLVGTYVLDFLCIHPFLDGNGRVARLLTLMLLYHAGYGVGRYVSLEKTIELTKESYYETLRSSSAGWHEGRHDPWPWLDYFVGTLVAAYGTFEERVGVAAGRGAKGLAILAYIDSLPVGSIFRLADVRAIAVGAGDSHISKILASLRDDGRVAPIGRGRGATWEKRR